MTSFLERAGARLIAKNQPNLNATINSFDLVAPGVAKIVATISGNFGSDPTQKVMAKICRKAIHASVEGVFCINNSFRVVPDTGDALRVVGFVGANRQSKPFEEKSSYKEIAKNVLMDVEDESVWEVSTVGGKKFMCLQGEEDISETLEVARVRDVSAPPISRFTSVANTGEYASWVDVENKDVRYGYVVASGDEATVVMCRLTNELKQIATSCLIALATPDKRATKHVKELAAKGQKKPKVLAAVENFRNTLDKRYEEYDFSNVDYNNIREYYKAVFAYAPEYYAEFEKIIDHYGF
jgi:hypothetical protein